MNYTDDTGIKDVSIINEISIYTPEATFELIYNDESGRKEKVIKTAYPIRVERLVTVQAETEMPQITMPLPSISSVRSFAVFLRNFILNTRNALKSSEKIDGLVYDLRGTSPNNVAHLMMDIIPFCLHVRNVTGQEVSFLMDEVAGPFQKLLDVFELSSMATNNKVHANCLKIFTLRGLSSYNPLHFDNTTAYALLPKIYDGFNFSSGLEGMDKIFIARRGVRGIANLDEVESLLQPHGYKTIFMEDYSMEEQLGIAMEAKDIIAVHGASMGMLVLNKDISSLIEIMAPHVYNDYFANSIGRNIKKHVQIIPYFNSKIPYNDWDVIQAFKAKEFSVDLQQLETALEKLKK